MSSEESLIENLKDKTILSEKSSRSKYHQARDAEGKEHFISMMHKMKEEKKL